MKKITMYLIVGYLACIIGGICIGYGYKRNKLSEKNYRLSWERGYTFGSGGLNEEGRKEMERTLNREVERMKEQGVKFY